MPLCASVCVCERHDKVFQKITHFLFGDLFAFQSDGHQPPLCRQRQMAVAFTHPEAVKKVHTHAHAHTHLQNKECEMKARVLDVCSCTMMCFKLTFYTQKSYFGKITTLTVGATGTSRLWQCLNLLLFHTLPWPSYPSHV